MKAMPNAPRAKPETEKLPELPKGELWTYGGERQPMKPAYTADQMRAYALAAICAQGVGATPDAAPDGSLRAIAKRNLASLIRIGSDDKELMLKCLEELS